MILPYLYMANTMSNMNTIDNTSAEAHGSDEKYAKQILCSRQRKV